MATFDSAEQGKPEVDAITTEKEQYLKDFADRVFAVAENEYQGGLASKNTAKSFLHASVFFESLKHFAPLTEETLGRIRYSKWKATEIVNAIAEGRVPGPDGLAERQLDEEMNGAGAGAPVDVPSSPAFGSSSYAARPPAAQTKPSSGSPAVQGYASAPQPSLSDSGDVPDVPVFSQLQLSSQRPPSQPLNYSGSNGSLPTANQRASPVLPKAPSPAPQPNSMAVDPPQIQPTQGARPPHESNHHAPRTSAGFTQFVSSRVNIASKPAYTSSSSNANADVDVILDATKFCKNAISALQFDDPDTAVKHLRAALRTLTGSEH